MTGVERPVRNTPEPPPPDDARPGRIPPFDRTAEESVLGAMMVSRWAVESALTTGLRADDFYVPLHRRIFEGIERMTDTGIAVDPVTLHAWLSENARPGQPPIDRQVFAELHVATPVSGHAAEYAAVVIRLSSKRKLIHAADEIGGLGYDTAIDPVASVERAHELVSMADMPMGGPPSEHAGQFLARHTDHEWAWPQCLEVGEKLLIVAGEKVGKSVMLRQVAACLSQGIDPFRQHTIPPALVYLLDLENPEPMVRRKLGTLIDLANTLERPAVLERLLLDVRPDGLDINHRGDVLWLMERLAANRAYWRSIGFDDSYPFVFVIGPVYKMLNDELSITEVRRLQDLFDKIRRRFHCALVMEAHAPHEAFSSKAPPKSLRPAGPRAWLRWPDFCLAFEASTSVGATGRSDLYDFYAAQGCARDERDWPTRLRRGGRLPWTEDKGM